MPTPNFPQIGGDSFSKIPKSPLGKLLDFPIPFLSFLSSIFLCCCNCSLLYFVAYSKMCNKVSWGSERLEVPPNTWITQSSQSLWFISCNFMIMSGNGALWPRKKKAVFDFAHIRVPFLPSYVAVHFSLTRSLFLVACLHTLRSKVTPSRESVISHT